MTTADGLWNFQWIRSHPLRTTGVILHVVLRTLFGIFWLAAGVNKIRKDWLTTDILREIFIDRLSWLPPDTFAGIYLQYFAIPLYKLIAWVVAFGELYAAIGLLLGLTTRWAAAVSLFILFNLAIGGYYDASLIPFFILNFIFLSKPSGRWIGLDRYFARRYPDSRLFT
jgi:thiosulfate dehydrogenase [quinone] large subunit